jgi:hypothetical protein
MTQLVAHKQKPFMDRVLAPTVKVTTPMQLQFATRALVAVLSMCPSTDNASLVIHPLEGVKAVRSIMLIAIAG